MATALGSMCDHIQSAYEELTSKHARVQERRQIVETEWNAIQEEIRDLLAKIEAMEQIAATLSVTLADPQI